MTIGAGDRLLLKASHSSGASKPHRQAALAAVATSRTGSKADRGFFQPRIDAEAGVAGAVEALKTQKESKRLKISSSLSRRELQTPFSWQGTA